VLRIEFVAIFCISKNNSRMIDYCNCNTQQLSKDFR